MSGVVLQLDPPLYVDTPLGAGMAIIYESDTNDVFWTVILKDSKAIVQFRNNQLHAGNSYTFGLGITDEAMRKIIAP